MNPKTSTANSPVNTNTSTNQANNEPLDQLMRRLETKGEQQVKQLTTVTQASILNIMKEGEKEFVQNTGRYMTYGEMRQLYG